MLIVAKNKKIEADLFRPKVLTHTVVEVTHLTDADMYIATSEMPFDPILTPTEKLLLCLPKTDDTISSDEITHSDLDEVRLKIAVVETQDASHFSFKLLEERKSDLRMYPRVWVGLNLSFYAIEQAQIPIFRPIVDLQDEGAFDQTVKQFQLDGCSIEDELFNFSVGGLQLEFKMSGEQCQSPLTSYLKEKQDLLCVLQMKDQPKVLLIAKLLRLEEKDSTIKCSIQWQEPNAKTVERLSEYTLILQSALLRL
jgi:hypothetical protein